MFLPNPGCSWISKFLQGARCYYLQNLNHYDKHSIIIIRDVRDASIKLACPTSSLPALLFFATVAVPVTPPPILTPVAVQLSPQAYPPGQHPPPPSAPQVNQPCAHPPSPKSGPVVAAGTPTLTPLLFSATLEETGGQDVSEQSLPVRQQPPW